MHIQLHHRHTIHVYYEDTDFSGFVYHANYLKFCERAREHLIGLELIKEMFAKGFHFVVKSAAIEYKKPARHADTLEVVTEVQLTKSPRVTFAQRILLAEGVPSATATIDLVMLGHANRPVRVPEWFLEKFVN